MDSDFRGAARPCSRLAAVVAGAVLMLAPNDVLVDAGMMVAVCGSRFWDCRCCSSAKVLDLLVETLLRAATLEKGDCSKADALQVSNVSGWSLPSSPLRSVTAALAATVLDGVRHRKIDRRTANELAAAVVSAHAALGFRNT